MENERIKPGYKLLLAGPDFLLPYSLTNRIGKELRPENAFNENTLMRLLQEYNAIFQLCTKLVGIENVHVIQTSFYFSSVNKYGPKHVQSLRLNLPKDLDFGSIETPFLSESFRSWPRDGYILLGDKILANEGALDIKDERIVISGLGDGGKVLVKQKTILVTSDIWENTKNEIHNLQEKGFLVGSLPFVEKNNQKYDFEETHIDGHAALIEDKNGQLVLLVAESYSRQGKHTKKLIKQGCESIGAVMFEIDDRNLPPLALNILQFEDGSIAITSSKTQDLEALLLNLVGGNKVFSTEIPLEFIPTFTRGGMRCLTNVIPCSYLRRVEEIRH